MPLATSQSVIVRFSFSAASERPSGEKAKLAMGWGDSILRTSLPVVVSKKTSALLRSPPPETGAATSLPSGEKARPGPVPLAPRAGPPITMTVPLPGLLFLGRMVICRNSTPRATS